ncbi:UDP-N-acetylglucosamine--N-acetylmuramyl-(pentapeptide) pyrophosphoryl-undecaprenol N-acetylglucosamine transferase [Frigoribacterium sp. CFBP9039]|uniref:UDP-N-acetylglucosamine--N-acetylmuramyl- (pentapeptide) pyrophosphoryl-undecaprenol N-acetylglucosamine transferase n=1 Tax=unclassified Frigoribacterium TaxID=2627005 RepID=UPI002A6A669D|nr:MULTISPECIES: UDP-N-acetylglucosamine--N-acetylmuramyl-(pentapeptide) pyrophosphoryl-undecaprenol N-acetylglucosamine transferase [unclassified Frigoribacterium]MDY0890899.1 UDP-N-acetylglucosamine--N-acetylmuramyl-(pentapeptide) pyrophosphoryl-undecaprenol N-acetylglucosamine transferase [Frigoribacterium sp. CFBP9030]MDY0945142.1 UDP-N-acetylglucosamine--N-acetylmuramyl-(pentapeptide) pyrophosphoryl-undecaprenol N-acetylglucosamine transferase [Frigoribacterium sp. CFBP9039]
MTTYLLAGGGTAGHVNPLLAVADRIRLREPDAVVLVLGTAEGLEARLVPLRGYELLTVPRLPFPRRPSAAALRFPSRLVQAVQGVRELLRRHRVDVVVGFGGYASAPAYVAAWRSKVPFVVHEANAKPGIANVLGSYLTSHVGTVFRSTSLRHGRQVGMPLRHEIETLDRRASRSEAVAEFGLDESKPTLLVTGGSSGAKRINETMSTAAASVLGAGWQILHITGAKSDLGPSDLPDHHLLRYCDRMDLALSAADFVVSRSGSATVSELTALGLPSVLVPYPVGNGEQRHNATDVVQAGGAVLVVDADFTPEWVASTLVPLLLDRSRIADMAVQASTVGVLDGTDRTVDLVVDAARPRDRSTADAPARTPATNDENS